MIFVVAFNDILNIFAFTINDSRSWRRVVRGSLLLRFAGHAWVHTLFFLINIRVMENDLQTKGKLIIFRMSLTKSRENKKYDWTGLCVDSNQTYDLHISHLVASCTSKLIQINRVKKSFDIGTLSLLLYCCTVWSNTSAKNVKKLQLVQSFACRIVTNTCKFDHISPALQYLNWL